MVTHGRVDLLAHPLSQKYLELKWNLYGKYFNLAYMLLYSIFLTVVTFFAVNLTSNVKHHVSNQTRHSLAENEWKLVDHTVSIIHLGVAFDFEAENGFITIPFL